MEMIKRLEPFALLLIVLGALNWGVIGLTDGETNVVDEIFSGTLLNVVYVVIGVAGLVYIPRLLDAMHLGGRSAHPRGT